MDNRATLYRPGTAKSKPVLPHGQGKRPAVYDAGSTHDSLQSETVTIERRGREWLWPAYDTELIRVFDQVDDLERILQYVPNRDVCVQAGGACGVWPARLVQVFHTVFTFEPDPLNFQCLQANAPDAICVEAALGAASGKATVKRHPSEATNCGAGYIEVGTDVPLLALDDVIERNIDLLLLDVEGAEYAALSGAQRLIRDSEPVIVIEEKQLPQGGDYLAARRLLETWGYREMERIHRDVVFTC